MGRWARLGGGLVTALVLLPVYVTTLSPTISIGDSGELITAAATLGIPHPPGYPLWCLVMRVVTLLPGDSPAILVNLGTAVFSVAAGLVFYLLATGPLALAPPLAATLTLVHGLSPVLWGQSVVAEIYAMNLAILLATCWLYLVSGPGLTWVGSGEGGTGSRWGRLVPYGVGLSLVSHAGNWPVLLVPVVGWIRGFIRGRRSRLGWLMAIVGLVIGLSPLLYLPLRSRLGPIMDWGHPASWDGFLAHLGREQYGGFRWPGVEVWLELHARWIGAATGVISPLGWLLAAWAVLRVRSRPVLPLLVWVILAGPITVTLLAGLLRGDQLIEPEVFLLPSFTFLLLLAGLGLTSIPRMGRVAPVLVLGWAVWTAVAARPEVDKSGNWIAYDHGRALLDTMPDDAVLFVLGDHEAFPLMYLQAVEGRRPDVTVRPAGSPVPRDIYGHPVPPLVLTLGDRTRPVLATLPKPPLDTGVAIPVGLAFDLRGGEPLWDPVRLRHRDGVRLSYFERVAVASVVFHEAAYRFAVGEAGAGEGCVTRAAAVASDNARMLNDLATLLAREGRFDGAAQLWERAVSVDPRNPQAWKNLIRLEEARGRPEVAREVARRAARHIPSFGEPSGQ